MARNEEIVTIRRLPPAEVGEAARMLSGREYRPVCNWEKGQVTFIRRP